MAVSDGLRDLLIEHLAVLGPVHIRRMFGGGGVYLDGIMFGLISDDVLYLKADDGNRPMFEAEGLGPFVYTGQSKPVTMSYWRAPERLLDEPDEMIVFARAALEAAHRNAAAKPAKAPRSKLPPKPAAQSRRSR